MIVFNIVTTLLIPAIMILGGVGMKKTASAKPNGLVGYRTTLSMKNQDTWEFANSYCGKLWVKFGVVFSAVTILLCVLYFFVSEDTGNILCVILVSAQTIVLVLTLIPVQKELHKIFNDDGSRK